MSWVYDATGVHPPTTPSGTLSGHSGTWRSVASSAEDAMTKVTLAVWDTMETNHGPAIDAFSAFMRSPSSGAGLLNEFHGGATAFSRAHEQAATAVSSCVATMQLTATATELYVKAVSVLPNGAALKAAQLLRARSSLQSAERRAIAAIVAAYRAVDFGTGQSSGPDDRGRFDEQVGDMWSALSDDDRAKIVQQMADDLAREYGMDVPVNVKIGDLTRADGSVPNGYWDPNTKPPTLALHEPALSDPRLLHTVAHEIRHGYQNHLVADKNYKPGWIEQMMINAGVKKHPFDEHNVPREVVERWEKNLAPGGYVRDPWDRYAAQPVERDARASGREFLNSLSEEKLREYAEKAGVDIP